MRDDRQQVNRKNRIHDRQRFASRSWLRLVGLAAVAVLLPGLGVLGLYESLQGWSQQLREMSLAWAVVFIIAAALLASVAVLPTHAISLAAGFVFNFWLGFAVALCSVTLAGGLGQRIAGWAVSPILRERFEQWGYGRVLFAKLLDANPYRATLAVALARLPPQVPFALGNVLAAAAAVPPLPFVLGTALGMAPRVAAVAWLGSQLGELDLTTPVGRRTLIVSLVLTAAALAILSLWSWRIIRRSTNADHNAISHASGNDHTRP